MDTVLGIDALWSRGGVVWETDMAVSLKRKGITNTINDEGILKSLIFYFL